MAGFWRSPKREQLLSVLDTVRGPDGLSLVSAGLVESAEVQNGGEVLVTLAIQPSQASEAEAWRQAAESALSQVKGVVSAKVVLTSHSSEAPVPGGQTRVRKGARLSDAALAQTAGSSAQARSTIPSIPGIGAILAVASAKGGVGKSTVAVNLARALVDLGLRVGLLDIDIYGPSIPTLLGTRDAEPQTGANRKLQPIAAWGLKTMSIGYLVDGDAPMVWRGPIVTSAIRQMLNDVDWGALDILVLDTPPGTGDAQLALAQQVPLSGAVLVSTPQEVALADVRRGAAMFAKTHVPILGLVETMVWLDQPDGSRLYLFGEGGASRTAEALGLPVLAEVPIDIAIRQSGDLGVPVQDAAPSGPSARIFAELAVGVANALANTPIKPAPLIRFVA